MLVEEVLSKESGGDGVREDGRPLAMYLRDGMVVFVPGGLHRWEQMPLLDRFRDSQPEMTRSARSG